MANPIKASDLYQDDGAIKKAIDDLEALQKAYADALKKINGEAIKLEVGVKKLNAANANNRKEIEESAKAASKLEKEYEKYTEALKDTNVQIQAVRQTTNQLNRVARLEANLAASKAGSYNALSAQYSLNKIRINQLTKAERENTEEGRELIKVTKEIYEEMKEMQAETGKTSLNVGNYEEAIRNVIGTMGPFGQAINFVGGALRKLGAALGPLALIVTVLSTLIAYFTRTQEGIDFVNRKIAGFKAVADVFIDRLAAIGKALKDDFIGTLKDAGTAVGGFFKDLATFNFSSLGARIGKAAIEIKGLTDEIREESKAAEELTGQLQQVARATQELSVRTAQSRAEIKRLNLIAEDTTRTFSERAAAAKAAFDIEKALLKEREALLQRELDLIIQQKNLGNSLFEDDQEIADKRIELANVQTESLELQTTINNKLNTINQQAAATAKKLNEELAESAAILGGPAAAARLEYDRAIEKIQELKTEAESLGQTFDFTAMEILAEARLSRGLSTLKTELASLNPAKLTVSGLNQELEKTVKVVTDTRLARRANQRAFGLTIADQLGLDEDSVEALQSSFSIVKQELAAFAQARTQAAQAAVNAAERETEAARTALETELQLQRDGFANRSEVARQELEQAKANQREAERERQRAQRAQLVAQAAEQAANLITATSKIWAQLGFPAAIPATAILWGSFIASKVRAAQLTADQFGQGGFEMLEGGSHQSKNDISLGFRSNGRERRAEGGEAMAIFSKAAVRRYGPDLPDIVHKINRLALDPAAFRAPALASPTVILNTPKNSEMEQDIRAIRRQGEKTITYDAKGRRIEKYKNLTRIYG